MRRNQHVKGMAVYRNYNQIEGRNRTTRNDISRAQQTPKNSSRYNSYKAYAPW